jgi:hypothetical protein
MPKSIRRFAEGCPALLALFLCAPSASAFQATTSVPGTEELLRTAHEEFLQCGERAVQAGKAPAPKTLNEAKSVFGVNCMTEFNLLASLTEATLGRNATLEEINQQFDFYATLIMAPAKPAQATAAQDKSDPATATVVTVARQAPPASCRGSVKKGTRAYNAGSFEAALCHWLPKARAGDAAAQNNIGLLFERGLTADTPQSDEQAAAWFRLSADQGNTTAMRNLAGVYERRGDSSSAQSWTALADARDAETRLIREQQRAQLLGALATGVACALGGCAAPAPAYAPSAANPYLDLSGRYGARAKGAAGTGSPPMSMCVDGSYVSGTCHMAPDGTWLGGPAQMAPNGRFVEQGNIRMTPNGGFVGGNVPRILVPDGTCVTLKSCRMTPKGTYIGQ